MASLPVRFPAAAWAPFLVLPFVLRGLPVGPGGGPMPWAEAAGHAAVLAALLAVHSVCYEKWYVRDPRRIMANEALARAWFVLYGFLIVASVAADAAADAAWYPAWYLALAAPWAALTWLVHRDQVRQEGYRWQTGLAILGLFLLGLALIGLVTARPVTFR